MLNTKDYKDASTKMVVAQQSQIATSLSSCTVHAVLTCFKQFPITWNNFNCKNIHLSLGGA